MEPEYTGTPRLVPRARGGGSITPAMMEKTKEYLDKLLGPGAYDRMSKRTIRARHPSTHISRR